MLAANYNSLYHPPTEGINVSVSASRNTSHLAEVVVIIVDLRLGSPHAGVHVDKLQQSSGDTYTQARIQIWQNKWPQMISTLDV